MQDCTTGNQTRQIYCPADADSPAFSKKRSKCGDEPTTVQACATRPECRATGRWFAGEWATVGCLKAFFYTVHQIYIRHCVIICDQKLMFDPGHL